VASHRTTALAAPVIATKMCLCVGFACLLIALIVPVAAQAATASTDVMFVFDTSGSMEPVLDEAKSEIEQVMTQLEGSLPNVNFGVAEVRDYGGSDYDASESDEPWRLDVPITSNTASVSEGIGDLFADGGGDGAEAYGRALWETDTNPNVGWRPGARHLIVLVADQVPHDPNVNEGIPAGFWVEPSPWDTGEELSGEWGIPGTQLREGEQLNFHSVLGQLASDGKPLEMVDYHDTQGDFIHYWESWARTAGGEAVEASESGDELATKLKQLVQAAACPTTATPSQPSPATPGTQPTALTPRFLHPGSAVVLTPTGSGFCKGQEPDLGGSIVSSLEEETPSKLAFRVPPTAANGLQLTSLAGGAGPAVAYGVDNFRYPWGFSIENRASNGSVGTYDGHIAVTQQDLDSVFKEIGGPGNEVYEFVKSEAESILAGGLCYGFGLLSDSLYNDAHGAGATLAYANSAGLSLSPGSVPYPLTESSSGSHALTHALLRAAASQLSPEARLSWHKGTSAASVEASLNSAFQKDQPALLVIKFEGGGHALLAFNYQKTGSGLNVDVVDPNLPWSASDPASDYDMMQVHVNADGSWSYSGTFVVGEPFGSPVGGSSGSLYVVPQPRSPGGLTLWYNSSAPALTQVNPAPGSAITAISYSNKAGHTIPDDVKPGEVIDDAVDDRLLIPTSHKLITITQSPSTTQGPTSITGRGFLDQIQTPGTTNETIETHTGGLSLPAAGAGDVLSVTSLSGGVQRTVTVTFKGNVHKPTIQLRPSGQVTLTSAGGTGTVKMQLFTYSHSAGGTRTRPETIRLHGHARIKRHTPKVKHRKHHPSPKRHKH
jgi:hypothetical protein